MSSDNFILIFYTSKNNTITLPIKDSSVRGTVTISWGTESTSTIDSTISSFPTHTFTSTAIQTVTISCDANNYISAFGVLSVTLPNLVAVTSFNNELTSLSYAFNSASSLTSVPLSIPSSLTDMSYMFYNASNFNQNLNSWNISNVINMSGIFYNASAFNNGSTNASLNPLWNTITSYSLLDTSNMFYGATKFNQDIENWDVSKVTNMSKMFYNASSFGKYIGTWNVSNVIDMSYMFYNTPIFNNGSTGFGNVIPLWNTTGICPSTKLTNTTHMFDGAAQFNQPIDTWVVSNVTDMSYMFNDATMFNQDIVNWNVLNVNNMSHMFDNAKSFNKIINIWIISNVTDMSYMFNNATSFNNSEITNNSSQPLWNTLIPLSLKTTRYMFSGASRFNQNIGAWNVVNLTDTSFMFNGATMFNQDIGSWSVSKVVNMTGMFYYATNFTYPLNNWNVQNVTNMAYMFDHSMINSTSFSTTLDGWNSLQTLQYNVIVSASNTTCTTTVSNLTYTHTWNIYDKNSTNINYYNYNINIKDIKTASILFTGSFKVNTTFNPPIITNFYDDSNNPIYINNGLPGIYDTINNIIPYGVNITTTISLYQYPTIYKLQSTNTTGNEIDTISYNNKTDTVSFNITIIPSICFNKNTKILCVYKNIEVYIPIENITTETLIKTYKHGIKKVKNIIKGTFINNTDNFSNCMYKMKKTENMIEDLIVTGSHSILVDKLTRDEKERQKKYWKNIEYQIDDKYLLLAAVSDKFEKINNNKLYTYYHLSLEDNLKNKRFGIWANGVLTETTYN